MIPYFPLKSDDYRLGMDAQALAVDRLIEVDDHYRAEIALKQAILGDDTRYYLQAAPGTAAMQWEAIELVLPTMARHDPQHFALSASGERWVWRNRLLGEETQLVLGDDASLPLAPLDWLGRQVQEDLLLMDGTAPGTPLVAGQLCFASGWCLDDMLGRSFLDIHGGVPLFAERMGRPADLMMQRLKPGRPVWRVNWTPMPHGRLNAAPRFADEFARLRREVTPHNAGDRCFFRIERQTLSRLPHTHAILFTIHTYQAPMAVIASDPARARRVASVLRTMPPAMRAYKRLDDYGDALLAYLAHKHEG